MPQNDTPPPAVNDCCFCGEHTGVNGTVKIDGEHIFAVVCLTCAADERMPGEFTPFTPK